MFLSCNKTEDEEKPDIDISSESAAVFSQGISFERSSGSMPLHFTALDSWTTSVVYYRTSGWLSIQPSKGNAGSVSMTVSAQDNTGYEEREAVVTIQCSSMTKSFKVKQSCRSINDVTVEEIMVVGSWLKIIHNLSDFTAPSIGVGNERLISWDPGDNAFYQYGVSHTYNKEGEHTIVL